MNSLANECDTIPSTGRQDSVLIAYDDLRKVNSKLVELEYEKEINDSLRSIIINDDKIIRLYSNKVDNINKQITQIKKERNIASWIGIGTTLLLVISLINR